MISTVVVVVLLLVQAGLLLLIFLLLVVRSFHLVCAISDRRTARPSSIADAATWGGVSRAASATRSNRAPASDGGRSTTSRTSTDRDQGSEVSSAALAINPGARERNRVEDKAAFGGTRTRAGGCGGELGDRAGGS